MYFKKTHGLKRNKNCRWEQCEYVSTLVGNNYTNTGMALNVFHRKIKQKTDIANKLEILRETV